MPKLKRLQLLSGWGIVIVSQGTILKLSSEPFMHWTGWTIIVCAATVIACDLITMVAGH